MGEQVTDRHQVATVVFEVHPCLCLEMSEEFGDVPDASLALSRDEQSTAWYARFRSTTSARFAVEPLVDLDSPSPLLPRNCGGTRSATHLRMKPYEDLHDDFWRCRHRLRALANAGWTEIDHWFTSSARTRRRQPPALDEHLDTGLERPLVRTRRNGDNGRRP